jgi:molybdenum cofactor cytidylyltransferase
MTSSSDARIAAVVLAAGRSQRMGQPKMLLPWGETTVIGQVVCSLAQAGLDEIVVVTGGSSQQVAAALQGYPARIAYNPRYAEDQMALSLQAGLASLPAGVEAALIALGDQPQMQPAVVRQVLQAYQGSRAPLVFPSYHMRRGHPWIIARSLWADLLEMPGANSLRELLQPFVDQIAYVLVDDDSILRDLDTPDDYLREQPGGQGA